MSVGRRFMISVHPEVEARVLAELRALQLMPSAEWPQPRAMEYDDMARLTYTSSAIKALLTPTLHSTAISVHLSPQTRHQTRTNQSFEAIHSML